MPTRCIKLKLIVPRSSNRTAARDLWTTHAVVHDAVSRVEQVYLFCRGRGYLLPEGEIVDAASVQADALKYARDVQACHGNPARGSDAEVLQLLRQLYEELIPSCLLDSSGKPRNGTARASRAAVGPLINPESKGGESVFDEIVEPLPDWVTLWKECSNDAEDASLAWLASDTGQCLLSRIRTYPCPGWVKAVRAGHPWQKRFIGDQEQKRGQAAGLSRIFRQLKGLGLLALMLPPVKSQLAAPAGAVSKWDYLVFRLAHAHLISWESSNHRAAGEYAAIRKRCDQQREALVPWASALATVREYERQRHEELRRIAQVSDERPFRISPRTIRGWDRLRDRWLAAAVHTAADRKQVLAEVQTQLRNRFGDPHLFAWLAADERASLWRDTDPLPEIARLNALEGLLCRKKEQAVCTVADPRLHPRWVQYAAKGDTNLKNYELRASPDGRHLRLIVPCLHDEGDGRLSEVQHEFQLAPSGQFEAPEFGSDGKHPTAVFGPLGNRMKCTLGSADLLLARRQLENTGPTRLAEGGIGPVWAKLALDVESQAPSEWLDGNGRLRKPAEQFHFASAWGKKTKSADDVRAGFRVLAVDLGVRCFAACSVFELVENKSAKGLAFQIDQPAGWWARHERSFLLRLPGEDPSPNERVARDLANDELRGFMRSVQRLGDLLRLSIENDPVVRRSVVTSWSESAGRPGQENTADLLEAQELERILGAVEQDTDGWATVLIRCHQAAEQRLGSRIAEWRQRTRPRARRAYAAGKSAWAIDYLTSVRRLLQRWTRHARSQGEIRRADRNKGGVFAARLLDHINALKKDRVKTGADLIVQAARGYRPGPKGGWIKAYAPCRLILFEDLARYRFRVDRPRFENSQLMKWAHRKIVEEATLQAEIYGIAIDKTSPGFSSRFHSASGTPGTRVRTICPRDLESSFVRERIEQEIDGLGVSLAELEPGRRIPWHGGGEFATLAGGKLCCLHADLNAAQNLGRRFWTRHADLYRLTAVPVELADEHRLIYRVSGTGERVAGGLRRLLGKPGPCRLISAPDEDGFTLELMSSRPAREEVRADSTADTDEAGAEIEELLEEIAPSRRQETFFRDPSGQLLRPDRWYSQKVFWARVRLGVGKALLGTAQESPF